MESESSTVDKASNVEFIKYGSIVPIQTLADLSRFESREVEVFEKIDGGNCQVRKVPTETGGFNVLGGSRANFLKGVVVKRRAWFQDFTKWMYSNGSLYNLPANVVLFGELAGNHTITYSPEFNNRVFLLDLFDLDKKRCLHYEEARRVVNQSGIEDLILLDILFKGQITEKDIKSLLKKPSQYYDGPKEGLVVKDYTADPQNFLKVPHPEFAEKRRKKDGAIDYLTLPRYKKAILRYLDESEEGTVLTESSFVESVRQDVLKEEGINYSPTEIKRRFRSYLTRGKLMEIKSYLSEKE